MQTSYFHRFRRPGLSLPIPLLAGACAPDEQPYDAGRADSIAVMFAEDAAQMARPASAVSSDGSM